MSRLLHFMAGFVCLVSQLGTNERYVWPLCCGLQQVVTIRPPAI